MFLLKLKSFFKKVPVFLKEWGMIIFLSVAALCALIIGIFSLGRIRQSKSIFNMLDKRIQLYDKHIDDINQIHDTEVKQIENAAIIAAEAIKQAEQQFDIGNRELDAAAKKKITKIVNETVTDPEKTTRKLAEDLGFVYIPKG